MFSLTHPECRDDEYFLSNVTEKDYDRIGWKTKRKGIKTYKKNGEEFEEPGTFPVFVSKSEVREHGM